MSWNIRLSREVRLYLFILSLPLCVSAQPPEEQDWDAFIGEGQNNYEMKMKANEAIGILSARMEDVIREISRELDEIAVELLKKNQIEWEDAAKSKCDFLSDSHRGGTHKGLAYGYAYIEEQVRRIEELFEMQKYRNTP